MSTTTYMATIGLEVHAELATKSKMFCGCPNAPHESEPNANTCPVCLGHPGTLPVPNEHAIEQVLRFGSAVGASLATFSEFDRKHYFYPDIPKAYQISQYAYPLLSGGSLCGITLTRVHLEEDTARSQHDKGDTSLIDFNRAGVPLMELVTEPEIHDGATAGRFARELQLMLQTLGISHAQMERGEMRVEANISVSASDTLGTKVEVKNLNSFRSVESAVAYEIERQRALLEEGTAVTQETRGWDEVKLRTYSQRSKETAKDYRYFPDPDIPKLDVPAHELFSETRLAENMPLLPSEKREKYAYLGLPSNQIELVIADADVDALFESAFVRWSESERVGDLCRLAANYLTSDFVAIRDEADSGVSLDPEAFGELMEMLDEGIINSRVGKDLLREVALEGGNPRAIASDRGLLLITDPAQLLETARAVLREHPEVVADYRNGKVASLQYLLGQGMKATRGTADPTALADALKAELGSESGASK